MNFSNDDFFSKCEQIRKKVRVSSHLQRNPLRKTSFFVQFHAPYVLSHLPDKVNTFRFQHNIQKLLKDRY